MNYKKSIFLMLFLISNTFNTHAFRPLREYLDKPFSVKPDDQFLDEVKAMKSIVFNSTPSSMESEDHRNNVKNILLKLHHPVKYNEDNPYFIEAKATLRRAEFEVNAHIDKKAAAAEAQWQKTPWYSLEEQYNILRSLDQANGLARWAHKYTNSSFSRRQLNSSIEVSNAITTTLIRNSIFLATGTAAIIYGTQKLCGKLYKQLCQHYFKKDAQKELLDSGTDTLEHKG